MAKSKWKVLLPAFVIFLHVILYLLFANFGISVSSASAYIMSKRAEKEEHYFTVSLGNGIELECDEATYDALIVDKDVQYVLAFRGLTPRSTHGFLEVIDYL